MTTLPTLLPPPLWLQNLAALSLQVTLVTAASATLAWAIRAGLPAARLAYWQLVLLICLVLPAAQPWKSLEPVPTSAVAQSEIAKPQPGQGGALLTPEGQPRFPLGPAVLMVLAAGAAIRFLWLLAGLASLRRFRRTSRTLDPLPLPMERAQQRLGVRADFRVSDRVPGPVTFGIRRPVILLPSRVLDMLASSQEAIACHELIHVRRRDWAWTAVEEVVLAVFWFHPAIWWLAGRIRLAREQVVDRETVAITESGPRYVEALLAVAGFDRETLLTPVTLFFEARHLVQRVTSVLKESPIKESTMSKKRLILRVVLGLCAAVAVARLSVSLFPLHALVRTSLQSDDGRPVQVESGGEFLLHGREIAYPESAVKQRVEGLVVAEVTVDAQGQVIDARILSGPEQLRKTVLSSLLEWHFDASRRAAGISQVAVRFRLLQEGLRAENVGVAQTVEVRMSQGALNERLTESRRALEQARRNGNTEEAERARKQVQELEHALDRGGTFELRTVEDNLENRLKGRFEELEQLRSGQAGVTALTGEREARLHRQIEELKSALAEQHARAGGVAGGVPGGVPGGVAGGVLGGIKMEGVSVATREALQGRLPRIGDAFNDTTLYQLRDVLVGIDRHLLLQAKRDREGNYWLIVAVRE